MSATALPALEVRGLQPHCLCTALSSGMCGAASAGLGAAGPERRPVLLTGSGVAVAMGQGAAGLWGLWGWILPRRGGSSRSVCSL